MPRNDTVSGLIFDHGHAYRVYPHTWYRYDICVLKFGVQRTLHYIVKATTTYGHKALERPRGWAMVPSVTTFDPSRRL